MSSLFRSVLDSLRARWHGTSRPARPKSIRKYFSPLLLEPLETRLTPAGLFDRLTSPLAASYLSTSDTVLVDTIGQLEGPGASGRVATAVSNLNVLQHSLDHLLDDLGAPVTSSSVLQSELNGMVSQCTQILNTLANQGDISVNLELSGGTMSLRSAVQDVRTALNYLAGTTSLSKLPSVSTIFASGEASLCNVSGSSAYSATSTSTTSSALAAAATTTTYLYVDQNNPNASDTGPGSATQPFKTIQAGANKATAGTTVLVYSGTYNEKVTIKNSGTSTAPIVFTTASGATVTVTGQANGFYDSGKSYVTIHGFTVTGTTSYGIYVYNTSNVTLDGNDVSYAGHPVSGQTSKGIYINLTTDTTVSNNRVHHNTDSGIYLTNGATRITIVGNETYANASQYTRQAPGIDLRTSGNTVYNNVSHDNEDTGIQLYAGAANNLVYNNVIYNNGDHGIDVSYPTGNILVSNSVYHNVTAGINMEGSATGTTLANNISVDNGINSPRTKSNIRVDANSQSGTTLDYDEVFLSVSGQVQFIWGTTFYYSLATFHSATGQETHGLEANPKWVAPASGNLQLLAGSPAIDSANSGATGESATDVVGNPRVDDPATPNTGVGLRSYDDRGAYEFQPTNGAPQASNGSVTTAEDTAQAITLVATDPDGDPLTYSIVSGPSHGTLSAVSGSTVTYTPFANYNGSDSFKFKASDGSLDSNEATVSITVTPVNDRPTADGQPVTTAEDTAQAITLTGSDVETPGSALVFTVTQAPLYGTLSGSGAGLTYTPDLNYNGPDSFKFTVTDTGDGSSPALTSNEATVLITVTPVNDAPVASDQSVTTNEGTAFSGSVAATDVDGDALTYSLVSGVSQGSLTFNADGTFTYTPAANFSGTDTFTYTVTDNGTTNGTADPKSATGTVTVTVNALPVAVNASAATYEDLAVTIDLRTLVSDVETANDALTFRVGDAVNGTVTLLDDGHTAQFIPASNYNGAASFSYSVTDTDGGTATASVTITPKEGLDFSGGIVRIGGTSAADTIVVTQASDGQHLQVSIGGQVVSNTILLSSVTEVRVWGRDGDDSLEDDLAIKASLYGGAGTDAVVSVKDTDFTLGNASLVVGGATFTLSSIERATLTGGASNNSFTINSDWTGTATVVGGAGSDTLIGPNTANTWNITGTNAGTLNSTTTFSEIESLTGGTGADTFRFSDGKGVSGTINGGTGTNTLDYSLYTTGVTVDLGASTATGTSGVFNIANVFGGAGSDTLIGPNTANTWNITGTNAGTLNSTTTFSEIESLTGGTGADTFRFSDGKGVSGTINGGTGTGTNTLDYSLYTTDVTVNLGASTPTGTGTGGVVNIANVFGGSGNDSLTGNSLANVIFGNGGIDTLKGGAGRDWLVGGSGADNLDGGDGDDLLIGGTTAYYDETAKAANLAAIDAIMAEWTRINQTYQQRLNHLSGATTGGLNGTSYLKSSTVMNDAGVKDTLTGGLGQDWFITNTGDSITDQVKSGTAKETKTVI